jgi:hypothetical protein
LTLRDTVVAVIRGTQMETFCPRCGTSRIGAFRFCRSCRLDFDALDDAPIGDIPDRPPAATVRARAVAAGRSARGYSGQSLLGMGVLFLVGIAALGGVQRIDTGSLTAAATPTGGTQAVAEPDAAPAGPGLRAAEPSAAVAVGKKPTAEATPKHTAKPKPKPTPKADKTHKGIFGNPWGYDFRPGSTISSPPAKFCDYFDCVAGFWDSTTGLVVQCRDGTFTQSGGPQDGCADHRGYRRTLHRH